MVVRRHSVGRIMVGIIITEKGIKAAGIIKGMGTSNKVPIIREEGGALRGGKCYIFYLT